MYFLFIFKASAAHKVSWGRKPAHGHSEDTHPLFNSFYLKPLKVCQIKPQSVNLLALFSSSGQMLLIKKMLSFPIRRTTRSTTHNARNHRSQDQHFSQSVGLILDIKRLRIHSVSDQDPRGPDTVLFSQADHSPEERQVADLYIRATLSSCSLRIVSVPKSGTKGNGSTHCSRAKELQPKDKISTGAMPFLG